MIKIETTQDGDKLSVTIEVDGKAEDVGYQAAGIVVMLMNDLHEKMPEAAASFSKVLRKSLDVAQNKKREARLS